MLDLWNTISTRIFDFLLGWLLDGPRWLAVIVVALLTALIFNLVRPWTTNQDRLGRAAADLHRLKALQREAKQAQDSNTRARLRATRSRVSLIKLTAEGWPTLAMLLPLGLLTTWAFYRLQYHAPRADETVTVVAILVGPEREPLRTAENDLLHLVPQPGLRAVNGWVQPVRREPNPPSLGDRLWAMMTFGSAAPREPDFVAMWQLQGDAATETYPLVFRWKDLTIEHELRIGQRIYSDALVNRPGEPIIEIRLREVRLFGIPGLGAWLPAWLVGYLLVTIPLAFLLKRLLRIC